MDYPAFAAEMKRKKSLTAGYLFYGPETYLRRRGADLVRAADPAFEENTLRIPSSDITWRDLLSELCTPPFMGGRKLVIVLDEGNWIHNEASNLKAYLAAPSPSATLVALSPGSKCPVPFQTKKLSVVICRVLKLREVQRWVQEEAERLGKTVDRTMVERLIARAGTDLVTLQGNLERLSLHAGTRKRITVEDVHALVEDDSEHKIYELAIAASAKDRPASLRLLHGLRGSGENPHSLLWRLAWQYRKMAEAKRLLKAGVRRFEVTSRLQITYYADKFLATVDAHSEPELLEKHQALLDADLALKTSGSGAEGAILDSLVCRLASEPSFAKATEGRPAAVS